MCFLSPRVLFWMKEYLFQYGVRTFRVVHQPCRWCACKKRRSVMFKQYYFDRYRHPGKQLLSFTKKKEKVNNF
jgi:hypothetical protein